VCRREADGTVAHVGWSRRVNGKPKWVCSASVAPTGETADLYYELHFTELWQATAEPSSPEPAPTVETIDVGTVAEYFIDRKTRADLDRRTLDDYRDAVQSFIDLVGGHRRPAELTPADFAKVRAAWAARFGPDRLAKFIVVVRTMFKWAQEPPIRLAAPEYGDEFDVPSRLTFKRHRAANRQRHGIKLFEVADLKLLLQHAPPKQRAMFLLALNGGLGNTDVSQLPLSVVDLDNGWIDYTRGKTGNDRRFPLWPETVAALRAVLALRAKTFAKWKRVGRQVDPAVVPLVFVTRQGRPYVVDTDSGGDDARPLHKDRVASEYTRVAKAAGVQQHGRGFYSLRRTHRTLADEVGDQRAAALVMGHEVGDMGGVYVQRISDERLRKVTDHVRSSVAGALGAAGPARARGSRAAASASPPALAGSPRGSAPRRCAG
jgi:integrase